ncbi:unnamed protein product [Meloidogyne enterolobii]|uniref:Uncharacterized protein n=1 Tax=Meloidogyne enterolobii TaxID=390850 RepID=A0ACB0ZCW1_MELEN
MLLLIFLPQLVLSNKISDIHYSDFDFYSPSDSPKNNWTVNYGSWLTLPSLDFAAAAYSPDPSPCLEKHKAKLVLRVQVPCDAFRDECWAFIAISRHFIIFSVRGTQTQTQLIVEIIESMTGGSVQHYFYESLQAIWNAGFGTKLAELKKAYPKLKVLFTGHSLGGAIASLASAQFAMENNRTIKATYLFNRPKELLLVTFGQPRVGNIEYAKLHRRLVPNSFRIVHRYDLVPHIPYCYERLRRPHKCIPLHAHGPFHHPTEIWYPTEEMNLNNSLFKICDGVPIGEDQNCRQKLIFKNFIKNFFFSSNAYFVHFQVGDHLKYFGKIIRLYGINGCL